MRLVAGRRVDRVDKRLDKVPRNHTAPGALSARLLQPQSFPKTTGSVSSHGLIDLEEGDHYAGDTIRGAATLDSGSHINVYTSEVSVRGPAS